MKILCLLPCLLLFGCLAKKPTTKAKNSHSFNLTISQNGNTIPISNSKQTIQLKKEEFLLSFDLYKYSSSQTPNVAQIAFASEQENLKYFKEADISGYDNPFYSGGTGMATHRGQCYNSIIVRDNGHHYVYYENDEDRRLDLDKKLENGKIRTEWPISKITLYDAPKQLISESSVSSLHMMFFSDLNNNDKIEAGEYHLVHMELN